MSVHSKKATETAQLDEFGAAVKCQRQPNEPNSAYAERLVSQIQTEIDETDLRLIDLENMRDVASMYALADDE